jgi:hypothetical protein
MYLHTCIVYSITPTLITPYIYMYISTYPPYDHFQSLGCTCRNKDSLCNGSRRYAVSCHALWSSLNAYALELMPRRSVVRIVRLALVFTLRFGRVVQISCINTMTTAQIQEHILGILVLVLHQYDRVTNTLRCYQIRTPSVSAPLCALRQHHLQCLLDSLALTTADLWIL